MEPGKDDLMGSPKSLPRCQQSSILVVCSILSVQILTDGFIALRDHDSTVTPTPLRLVLACGYKEVSLWSKT